MKISTKVNENLELNSDSSYIKGIGGYDGTNPAVARRIQDALMQCTGVKNIISLTKAEYDALTNKDSDTIYVVEDSRGDAEPSYSYKLYKGSTPIYDYEIATIAEIDALFSEGGGGSGSGSGSGGGGGNSIEVVLNGQEWSDMTVGSSGSFDVTGGETLFGLDTYDEWSNVEIFDINQFATSYTEAEHLVSYSMDLESHKCTARVTVTNPDTTNTFDIVFEWYDLNNFGTYYIVAS